MRLLAMMLLLLVYGLCQAQQGALGLCVDKQAADPAFAILAGKLALGALTSTAPDLVADASLANSRERDAIVKWTAARAECMRSDMRYGNQAYRPPLQVFSIDAENKLMAAAVDLYDRKISFGEFNRRRQAIAAELRKSAAALSRRLESQRADRERADQQLREHEQMQREIDEAERQAAMARQESEQAQRAAARQRDRPIQSTGPRHYHPAPIRPHRSCFRFGNRIICTGW